MAISSFARLMQIAIEANIFKRSKLLLRFWPTVHCTHTYATGKACVSAFNQSEGSTGSYDVFSDATWPLGAPTGHFPRLHWFPDLISAKINLLDTIYIISRKRNAPLPPSICFLSSRVLLFFHNWLMSTHFALN